MKKPRYIAAKEYLLAQIRTMEPGSNRLEPEHQLAEKLGMSRETIRKAMTELIHEGVVTSRHGKGNYGHPGVTNLPMRMDINSDFRRILTHAGFAVRTVRTTAVSEEPSPGMVRRMPEIAGRRVAAFDQLFYADGRLAIVCRVELPDDYLITAPEAGEYTENINEFLHSSCRRESSHTTAWLTAGTSSQAARRFGLDPSAPLLEWEEVYYDMYDMKIGYVKNYFHPEIMDLSLLLKF